VKLPVLHEVEVVRRIAVAARLELREDGAPAVLLLGSLDRGGARSVCALCTAFTSFA